MDIISHTLTGVAVGTVVATISNSLWKSKGLIILLGGLGGALPDLDAISLWSKFDTTIGSFFRLSHSGKEIYFGKFWYSHHAALHSLIAPIILILLVTVINVLFTKKMKVSNVLESINTNKFLILAFFFGFLFHLFEDMPTPASVWGGVNLLFPSASYIGGFGNIWWWNNYDLVLIIFSVIVLNLCVNILPRCYYLVKVRLCVPLFLIGVVLFLVQINTRTVGFSYTGTGHTVNYNKFEAQSKNIQREILGEKLFNFMVMIDNKISLNF